MPRWLTSRALIWAGYGLLLLAAPLVFDSGLSQSLLCQMGIAIIVCLSYNLLLGQGGMLSFGHAAYSGVGAFLAIHTLNRVSEGLPLPVSLIPLVGGLAGFVLAVLLGWVTCQKAATPFAMITFGMGELVWAIALMFPGFFGGEAGVSGNRVAGSTLWGISFGPQIQLYYLIAAYTFVCTALLFALTGTPLGRMLNAVRDNPQRVAFVGYDPQMVRYLAFVIAAFFAGVSGGLAALNFEIVTSEVVSGQRSGAYLLFTFLGGSTFFFGPIVGAVLMVLALALLSSLTKAWLLYLGLVFVLMVVVEPGGLAAWLVRQWQQAQYRLLRRLWPSYLLLVGAAALALAATSTLIELVYHLQHSAVIGPELRWLQLTLSVQNWRDWLSAATGAVVGFGLLMLARRRLARQQTSAWQQIELQTNQRGLK